MSNYVEIIKEILKKQYPYPQNTKYMVISTLNLKFIPAPSQPLLEKYQHVTTLTITRCHMRNLEHFPRIKSLTQLNLSHNQLMGTLRFLMPLTQLVYLDLTHNLIPSEEELYPLKRIPKIQVCVKDNPFSNLDTWKHKLKGSSIKFLKQPKDLSPEQNEHKPKLQESEPHVQDNLPMPASIFEQSDCFMPSNSRAKRSKSLFFFGRRESLGEQPVKQQGQVSSESEVFELLARRGSDNKQQLQLQMVLGMNDFDSDLAFEEQHENEQQQEDEDDEEQNEEENNELSSSLQNL